MTHEPQNAKWQKKLKQTQIVHTQLKQKTKKTIRSKIMLNGENEPKSRKKEVSNQLEHQPNVNRQHIKPFIKYFKENGFMNCCMHAVYTYIALVRDSANSGCWLCVLCSRIHASLSLIQK